MFMRDAFIASLLGIFGYATTAYANSCGNVNLIGTFDESGLRESEYGISAAGTFRIAGEGDEAKQPMFNLATVDCEKQSDDTGRVSLECKVTKAVVWSDGKDSKPDPDNPNCSLDLDSSTYSMKELLREPYQWLGNSPRFARVSPERAFCNDFSGRARTLRRPRCALLSAP
jgi:hypothetical protein